MTEEQVTPAESQTSEPSSFSIPEEYADRGWAEKIKTPDDLWKQLDNTQSLLGKRPAGIPQDDATPEQWDEFYKAKGRPDSPDKYELSDPEGLPDDIDLSPFKAKAQPILHAAGLSPKEAERVWSEYLKAEMSAADAIKASHAEATAKYDEEFDALAKEKFGDNYDAANEAAQKFLNESLDEKLRLNIAEADPRTQVALIAAASEMQNKINAIKKEYSGEDTITVGDQASGTSITEARGELAKLRASAAAKDFTHPESAKTRARIEELSGIVQRHYK